MSFYEIVFVVRPDVATEQVDALTKRFSEIVTKDKGKVVKTENWGLRTLAYRIKKHKKAYYVMLCTEMNGSLINEIERQMRLSEDIIRFSTIKVDAIEEGPSPMMKAKRYQEERAPRETAKAEQAAK